MGTDFCALSGAKVALDLCMNKVRNSPLSPHPMEVISSIYGRTDTRMSKRWVEICANRYIPSSPYRICQILVLPSV